MHAGRNIAIIGALRDEFRLSFFNAALLDDRDGLLQRQGPNTRHPDCLRFTGLSEVQTQAPAIRALVAQAMAHAQAGRLPPREPGEIDLPQDLTDALDADPELAEAFHGLTPGRQRSHVIALSSAKTSATRLARIDRLRPRIMSGKGATER
jgi:uncharacterized protein YdeI (YjbR/CyaY-like superfamily)